MKIVPYKRKRKGKTDYLARKNMLKSQINRLVIRKTNRYIIAQVVESRAAQDKIIFSANSRELLNSGWPKEAEGSLKSIPAAYLTGLLLGKKTSGKIKKVIIDLGLNKSSKGNRLYSVILGLSESGIETKCNPEMFPDKERINGANLKKKLDIESIKNKILK
jgi:large subunit ribosomal protein L18